MGRWNTDVPSPGAAAFSDFAAQAIPAALHTTPLFGFNPADARVGKG